MNKQEKEKYLADYKKEKEKGVPFFPDIIFKDAIIAFLVFLALIALAALIGAPLEKQANPSDTSYIPRPEWYFLFLYQALKYFPGNLEVVGAIIIPGLAVLVLFALPFIDRNSKRHALNRPVATGIMLFAIVLIVGLTVVSVIEAPAQSEVGGLDMASRLYIENCASCHDQTVIITPATNTYDIIASGGHEGGGTWNANLSEDQIIALAAYVNSPHGDIIFDRECGACHELDELTVDAPLELVAILDQGPDHPSHLDVGVVDWGETLPVAERNVLLNFLTSSPGEQLYISNCGGCHGSSINFKSASNPEPELRDVLMNGAYHKDLLTFIPVRNSSEANSLAQYLVDPAKSPEGPSIFETYCSECHFDEIPSVQYIKPALTIVTEGGNEHEVLPDWSQTLTPDQIDTLVSYTVDINTAGVVSVGGQLYQDNCSICHGPFGEGGANPGQPGDIIAPISSSEYLRARDNVSLMQIISYGQPNFGMSPFAQTNGGSLTNEQIESVVAFIRQWQVNPPVEIPPEVDSGLIALGGDEIFQKICASCHGIDGKGVVGPSLNSPEYRAKYTVESMAEAIMTSHENTIMIGWRGILTSLQIYDVVNYIYLWGGPEPGETVSFSEHLLPLFERTCYRCHGPKLEASGWRADSYEKVMESGLHYPTVLPGDPDNSLLIQKLLNTQSIGGQMPPSGKLDFRAIQWIIDWIAAGAPDN